MSVNNVWSSAGSTDGNVAGNWSLGWVPKAGDVAYFDATSVVNCTFSAAVSPDAINVTAAYSGDVDFNDKAITTTGDQTYDGTGTVDCGASVITCSGNFDNVHQTWTKGTSVVVMDGTGKNILLTKNQLLYDLTISGSITLSYAYFYGSCNDLIVTVSGTFTVNAPFRASTIVIASGGILAGSNAIGSITTISNAGTIQGAITLNCFTLSNTDTIQGTATITWNTTFTNTGTIGATVTINACANAGNSTINGGTHGGTWSIERGTGFGRSCTFAGNCTFTGDVTCSDTFATSSFTIDNSGNHDLTFQGDLTLSEVGGTITWTKGTGTITISGASDQELDFGGETTEEIIVDKSAGLVSFTGDVSPDYFEANGDTGGSYTLDLGGHTITAGGKVDIDGGADGAAFEVLSPDCTGSYPQNGTDNGEPAYEREDGAYWIWWSTVMARWEIRTTLGGKGTHGWLRSSSSVAGDYTASGIGTGTATVAEAGGTCTVTDPRAGSGFVVGNDGLAAGTLDGVSGTQLDLMGLAFDLQNSSTLVAKYCDISWSAVSNGTGDATAATNSDGGDNTNWSFASASVRRAVLLGGGICG